jgi:hypothetical protein
VQQQSIVALHPLPACRLSLEGPFGYCQPRRCHC